MSYIVYSKLCANYVLLEEVGITGGVGDDWFGFVSNYAFWKNYWKNYYKKYPV